MAYDHATKCLQDGVAEAGTWTRASFGGHQDLLEEAVGLYRRTLATAKAKFGFMDVVPWLFAGLDHDGVRARNLQQRESTPPAQHHAITRLFLIPATDLRRAIDDMAGGNMAPCSVTAMMRLRLVHLDDSVGEGPHSPATRIGAASRASTWGSIASTMRMKQNLVEFVSLTDEAHLWRRLWGTYKYVLQRRQQSRVCGQRHFRCSRALLEKQVYVLDSHFDATGRARGHLEGGQEDPDEGAIVAAPPRGVDAAGLDDTTLARDHLDAALPWFAYVSVPAKSGSVVPWIVFQVLAKSAKPILVKTIATKPRHPLPTQAT